MTKAARRITLLRKWILPTLLTACSASRWDGRIVQASLGDIERAQAPTRGERIVRFQATEGTWMSVDVSPDGSTIVFDLLGDVWTMPIAGGVARRLTSGTALHRQPRYSPDGRHLVFVSDRDGTDRLWIAAADGTQARSLGRARRPGAPGEAVTSPAWSLDGKTIIASRFRRATAAPGDTGGSLYPKWLLAAYDVKTGQMRWVSDTARDRARSALGAAVLRDGRTLLASVDESRKDEWQEAAAWRVSRVDLMTGLITPETSPLPSTGAPVSLRPAVSPDERYLVYVRASGSRWGLRIRDRRSDQEWWLAPEVLDYPLFHLGQARDLSPGYAFTPDSRALIIAYGGKIHRIDVSSGKASVIPFLAEVERELLPLTVHQFSLPDTAVFTRSVMQPALSPDGRQVAFSALDRLWIMDLPQDAALPGRPRRATADSGTGEFYPSWSPDGRWIVYSTWLDGASGGVRRVRVPPGRRRVPQPSQRLTTDTAVYFHTGTTADGSKVIAVRASASAEAGYAGTRPGSEFTLVTLPAHGGDTPKTIMPLASEYSGWYRYPVGQVYATAESTNVYVGLESWSLGGAPTSHPRVNVPVPLAFDPELTGVFSPDLCRALIHQRDALYELRRPACGTNGWDTLDLTRSSRRWESASAPWISWARDGRRVLFSQGGALFVGDVRAGAWTAFRRVDVPLTVPVDTPRGTLVLRGARLITMRGQEIVERGDLIVRDNRIVAIGATGQVPIPSGARVLDLYNKTVIPGYVDLHDHARPPEGVHPGQLWDGLVRLAHGVTAFRDLQPGMGHDIFVYRERERTGELIAPRIFTSGPPYYGAGAPMQTLAGARERLRVNAEYFNTESLKIYLDAFADRRERQLLLAAAAQEGLNATAHTDGPEMQLAGVIDGLAGLEHPEGASIYDDVATLIARSGVTHTHTYLLIPGALSYMIRHHGGPLSWPRMRRFVPPSARADICVSCSSDVFLPYGPAELEYVVSLVSSASRIVARGGRVGVGGHGNIPGIGFHYEMWLLALGGMRAHDVLRAATRVGATAIGHAADFGSLEPGKLADLQILDENPLEDIHRTMSIRYVMKNGRLYQADDLTEIWPRNKPLSHIYIWDESKAAD